MIYELKGNDGMNTSSYNFTNNIQSARYLSLSDTFFSELDYSRPGNTVPTMNVPIEGRVS